MKNNTESLGELFLPLENRIRALEDAGIGGTELKKTQDEVAVLIFMNSEKLLRIVNVRMNSLKEDQDDLISELIVLFYEKYKASEGRLYPFLKVRLKNMAIDKWRKEQTKLPAKYQEEKCQAENKPSRHRRNITLESFRKTYEDTKDSSEYTISDDKMDQERDLIAALEGEEAFLHLSALVTSFFEERDHRSGTLERFRYYKAAYTENIINYVKADDMLEPPEFQHEVDIIRATDVEFANFVTFRQPYSGDNPLGIHKIFFNELEYNRAVVPSYVKNTHPNDVISIPMKPFIMGGFMERVHHMKVSESSVSQQMKCYKDDAAEVLHQIGTETSRYKKNKKKKSR